MGLRIMRARTMIEQRDDSVTIRGKPLLGAVYRAVLLGVAHRRANGTPSDDLRQLAKLLYRAYMSPRRHELATAADTPEGSKGQDGELIGSAEAARMLVYLRVAELAAHVGVRGRRRVVAEGVLVEMLERRN